MRFCACSRYHDAFAWRASACLTKSVLQVVNRLVASCLLNFSTGLLQVVGTIFVTSLQMASYNKPDLNFNLMELIMTSLL